MKDIYNLLEKINNKEIKTFYIDKINEVLNNGVVRNIFKTRKIANIKGKIKLFDLVVDEVRINDNAKNILNSLKFRDYLYDEKENPILIYLDKENKLYYFLKTEYLENDKDIIITSINKEKQLYLKIEKNNYILYNHSTIDDYHINDINETNNPIKIYNNSIIEKNLIELNKNLLNNNININCLIGMIIEYNYDEIIEDKIVHHEVKENDSFTKELLKGVSSDLFKLGYYDLGKECVKLIDKLNLNEI